MNATSGNKLTAPKGRRKLTTMNIGYLVVIAGIVGIIILLIASGISRGNAAGNEIVNGGARITGGSNPDDLGNPLPSPSPAALTTAAPIALNHHPSAEPSRPPQTGSGGGGADDSAASEAREARRRKLEQERQQLEQLREREESSMRSLGDVPLPDVSQVAMNGQGAEKTTADGTMSADEREYAPPSGPILALLTLIPVRLTWSVNSTFGGQYPVTVRATKDQPDGVRDETGRVLLIPVGSTCYVSSTAGGVDGQQRLYGAASMCKLPNRERLTLDNFPAIDIDGATGLKARVDDHGAGRRNRSSALLGVPGMLGGFIPGAGIASSAAESAASVAQSSQVGRAYPGPTLFVDATPDKPRDFYLSVTRDTSVRPYADTLASPAPQPSTPTSYNPLTGAPQ
jgi:type IV secretory pathway VirB10-like protein